MPDRPIEAHLRKDNRPKLARIHHNYARQHGHHIAQAPSGTQDVLLRIPSESLTHVTSFLDPPDLFILAQTCKRLNTHVTDDNTWRRAYAYQYLGITPESDLSDDDAFMLRKEESSWKREFILRYNLRRRWAYSRNTTITHIPHHSTVTAMHLMPQTTVLAASLQYGVVSRSYPLTGKVLRGFFDAAGTMNGLGIGNPNAEFSPHVSCLALASEGGTAKIIWGFRNGEVAVTIASRAMDHNRTSAAKLLRCRPPDSHESAVQCVAWASDGDGYIFFVSGGADGRVRLWEATASLRCLWASNVGTSLVADPCVKVAIDLQQDIISAALRSGAVLVWIGFGPLSVQSPEVAALQPRGLQIPALILFATPSGLPREVIPQEITDLQIAPDTRGLSLLVAYRPNSCFYRFSWNDVLADFDRSSFGDATKVPIRTVFPVWASRRDERNFVITGDEQGNIAIFFWDATLPTNQLETTTVRPAHRFVAHEDAAVTALGWNSVVLASGSSQGTIKVWDALTFDPLRKFSSPVPRPVGGIAGDEDFVGQILLERDALVASVGNRVLAWKAGPVGRSTVHGKAKAKGVRAASGRTHNGVAKWQQQIEMYRDIAESCRELEEEQTRTRRVFGREKEQMSTLAHLGLNEVEAVEYMLMVSRDEEEARRREVEEPSPPRQDEGVFMADFDDVPTPVVTPVSMFGSGSPTVSSNTSPPAHLVPGLGSPSSQVGCSYPGMVPSSSYHKIQVLPRVHREPMEAGFSGTPLPSRSSSSSSSSSAEVPPLASNTNHFPAFAVSRTCSSTSTASGSSTRDSACSSPQSVRSAWSTPLRSLHTSEAPSPSRIGGGSGEASQNPARSLSGVLTSGRRSAPTSRLDEDEDEDLKFAIRLSLAEAMSREENL